jgi:hypothetical protein
MYKEVFYGKCLEQKRFNRYFVRHFQFLKNTLLVASCSWHVHLKKTPGFFGHPAVKNVYIRPILFSFIRSYILPIFEPEYLTYLASTIQYSDKYPDKVFGQIFSKILTYCYGVSLDLTSALCTKCAGIFFIVETIQSFHHTSCGDYFFIEKNDEVNLVCDELM